VVKIWPAGRAERRQRMLTAINAATDEEARCCCFHPVCWLTSVSEHMNFTGLGEYDEIRHNCITVQCYRAL
jgi:hypothetical protein